jgi:hypothetical protein
VLELTPDERRLWATASGGIVDEFVKKARRSGQDAGRIHARDRSVTARAA